MTTSLGPHLFALTLVALDMLVRGVRFRLLLPREQRISFWQAIEVNAYGDAASAVTPARLGGEVARFIGFRRSGVQSATTVVVLGVEKVVDWILILLFGVLLSLAFADSGVRGVQHLLDAAKSPMAGALILVVIAMSAAGVLAIRRYRRRLPPALARPLGDAWHTTKTLSRAKLGAATTLTVVSMAARVAILPILVAGSAAIHGGGVILGSFVLLFGQLVLPTPAGVGGVELGFIGGFAGSMSAGELAALLIAWRFYTVGVAAIIGAALLLRSFLRRSTALVPVVAVVAVTSSVSVASAQTPHASRLLPVDHWSYDQIQRIRERGYLENLNPLLQPYRRLDVARGLVNLDAGTLSPPVADWVRMLQAEFAFELERLASQSAPQWGVAIEGGLRAATTQRLDVLRPVGGSDLWPGYRAGGWLRTGPATLEVRVLGDLYFRDDPDGKDPGQRRGGRTDHAYASADFSFGGLILGRFKRNWSMLGGRALLVSDVSTSYPQLGVELRLGRFALRAFTGELDTISGHKRYIAAQRVDYASDRLTISVGQAIVYGTQGGLQLRFLNPAEFLFFEHDNEPMDAVQNLLLQGQVWFRQGPIVLWAEGVLDDIDLDPTNPDGTPADQRAPTRYAFAVGARVTALASWLDAGARFEQVSAFAYRTVDPAIDRVSFLDRGLGPNFVDYQNLELFADIHAPVQGLRVTPVLTLHRQGEGDLREPIAIVPSYRGQPSLFLGVRETTFRLGLRGRYQPTRYVWISWDIGENFVDNARHQEGNDVTEFVAVAAVGVRFDFPRSTAR